MSAEQSKPGGQYTLKLAIGGVDICYKSGEKSHLSVKNGGLDFFHEIGGSNDAPFAAGKAIAIVIFSQLGKYLLEQAKTLGAAAITSIINSVSNLASIGSTATGALRTAIDTATGARAAVAVADDVAAVGANAARATLGTGAKVFAGVGGGLGIAFGIVDMGLGINALVNGTATLNQLVAVQELVGKAEEKSDSLDEKKKSILREAKEKIDQLVVEVDKVCKGTNGTKIAGGIFSIGGGSMAIAGIFFPPLLIPAAVIGGIGAAASITATIVELSVDHQKRFQDIVKKLGEDEIHFIG